jgi:DNA processing protein
VSTDPAWLAVATLPGLDLPTIGALHGACADPYAVLAALADSDDPILGLLRPSVARLAGRAASSCQPGAVADELDASGVAVVAADDDTFGARLQPPEQWPPVLSVKGRLRRGPAVAIVGMRQASRAGCRFARALGADLAARGVTIVSGLAFGIDRAAHEGALDAGGHTIAVLAGGCANVSPRRHIPLATAILDSGGALISHVRPRAPSPGWRFPVRNRLIAGLADVVVVVEAAGHGGALSSASHARELGRSLMAVPGFPWSERSAGTNALLVDGAEVCRGPADVVTALHLARPAEPPLPDAHTPSWVSCAGIPAGDAALFAAVDFEPMPLDAVIDASRRPLADVVAGLNRLERAGLVTFPTPATVQRCAPPSKSTRVGR